MDQLITEEKYFFTSDAGARVKNLLGVVAGKGGVGKSTVTVNLGLALKKMGYQVGILDADLYGPSLQKMIPEDKPVRQKNSDEIIPAEGQGIKMISMAYFSDHSAMVVRAPIANALITQFLLKVDWGQLDYLLIDFPPGTGDIQLTLMQEGSLSGAVIVTTPQEIALLDVRRAIQMVEKMQVPVLGIVENMSYWMIKQTSEKVYPFGKGGAERLSKERGAPVLGQIPIDPFLNSSMDLGNSIFTQPEGSSSAAIFLQLAEKVIENLDGLKRSAGLKSFELIWEERSP